MAIKGPSMMGFDTTHDKTFLVYGKQDWLHNFHGIQDSNEVNVLQDTRLDKNFAGWGRWLNCLIWYRIHTPGFISEAHLNFQSKFSFLVWCGMYLLVFFIKGLLSWSFIHFRDFLGRKIGGIFYRDQPAHIFFNERPKILGGRKICEGT